MTERRIAFAVAQWSSDATLYSWTWTKQFFLRVRPSDCWQCCRMLHHAIHHCQGTLHSYAGALCHRQLTHKSLAASKVVPPLPAADVPVMPLLHGLSNLYSMKVFSFMLRLLHDAKTLRAAGARTSSASCSASPELLLLTCRGSLTNWERTL